MDSAKAFAPANISCIFRIYEHKHPRWMGSYGLGFTLNEGVIITAEKSKKTEVIFNNTLINIPTIKSVISELTKESIRIYIKTRLPLGCGFGLSGASALAAAYAVNNLLNLRKPKKELAIIAHIAEVENKTGLGDVVNQFYGGCCLKLKPSSHFVIKKIQLNNMDVYCKCYGKLLTKSILTNAKLKLKINKAASDSLKKLQQLIQNKRDIYLKDIIKTSKEFAVNSGLLSSKKAINAIREIEKNKGSASMIMLGNAVFSDKPFKGAKKLKISGKGAHLI